ncbi:MAG: nitroreductase family protein [Bacteroidales bacterium]|nr:nitroreductase family protein [Clostridium sp.]MCM1202852.1 nitroreductase family protein [Bacteroidales bacterium]
MSTEEIFARRSIRKYRNDGVSPETVNRILEAGRAAPSGKNRQPWRFLVYGGREKEELLAAMKAGIEREQKGEVLLKESRAGLLDALNTLRIMETAPLIIMVENPCGKSPFCTLTADERFTELTDTLSIGAAIENMLLKAQELGVGTLWIANTCYAYPELTHYMGTEGQLVGGVALGYADESPEARPRKELEHIVEYHW